MSATSAAVRTADADAALLGVAQIGALHGGQQQLRDRHVPHLDALTQAALHATGAADDERGFLISGDLGSTDGARERMDAAQAAVDAVEEFRVLMAAWSAAVETEIAGHAAAFRL
jgi:hypothetical protein